MSNYLMRLLVLSVVFALTAVMPGCGKSDSSGSGKGSTADIKKQKYHCPMHPTYVSDRPGDCPICNMKLMPFEEDVTAASKSGQDMQKGALPGVPNHVSIVLSPEKRQMIGLQLSPVEKRELSFALRTTARVEHDETRLANISPRFSGWIRDLKVNFTGAPVEKGQPLCMVYSPELLTAEKEYILAIQNYEKQKDSPDKEQVLSAQHLLDSSRRRLVLWQIDEKEIHNLEESRIPADETLLRAPFSGHVIAKTAVEGRAFTAGETLYEIADLSHLWLRASVFEYQMSLLAVGQDATIDFPYLGGQSFPSKITFIYPHIDPLSRRGEIRLELDNPKHLLRPDMWADVEIKVVFGKKLAVPSSAVIDTGVRYIAFVEAGEGRLEPRELKIGVKTDEYYEVLEGAKEGEKVVTRALFLVDSESQLKAAISGMDDAGEHKH